MRQRNGARCLELEHSRLSEDGYFRHSAPAPLIRLLGRSQITRRCKDEGDMAVVVCVKVRRRERGEERKHRGDRWVIDWMLSARFKRERCCCYSRIDLLHRNMNLMRPTCRLLLRLRAEKELERKVEGKLDNNGRNCREINFSMRKTEMKSLNNIDGTQ